MPASLPLPLLWHSYLFFWISGLLSLLWPLEGLGLALLILLADQRLWQTRRIVFCLLLCLFGFLLAAWQIRASATAIDNLPEWLNAGPSGKAQRICAKIQDVQGLPGQRLRIILGDIRLDGAEKNSLPALRGKAAWTWEDATETPLRGQELCLTRTPQPMRGFVNDPTRLYEMRWAAKEVYWRLWTNGNTGQPQFFGVGSILAGLRHELFVKSIRLLELEKDLPDKPENRSAKVMPNQAKAILLALIFGDRYSLEQKTVNDFSLASLAHSLALSGQHLAVVALLGLICIGAVSRARPKLYLAKPKAHWVGLASCPLAIFYLWLGNAPPSLLRAFGMFALLTFWLWHGRGIGPVLDLLCLALCLLLLVNPLGILDLGLQLSVLCVAIIAISIPALKRLLPAAKQGNASTAARLIRSLLEILLISFALQIALLPLNLAIFGNPGLFFALNVLWLPILGIWVLPAAFCALFLAILGFDSSASALFTLASLPCETLLAGLNWLEQHGLFASITLLRPHSSNLLAYVVIFTATAYILTRSPSKRIKPRLGYFLLLGLMLLAVGPSLRLANALSGSIRLDVMDVGQGQAAILQLPDGLRLLIDGGGTVSKRFDPGKAILAPELCANRPPRLSASLNSHPDLDHLGGMFYILEEFPPAPLFHNGREARGEFAEKWRNLCNNPGAIQLAAGDKIILGNPKNQLYLEALHPPGKITGASAEKELSGNSASLVMRLTAKGKGLALFTGDADNDSLKALLASGQDLRSLVVLAPHHGSDHSFLADFYRVANPALVIASCGFRNRYGYPGKKLQNWLKTNKIPLLDTARNGRISLKFQDEKIDEIRVAEEKQEQLAL